jgi:hypothetical protein
MLQFGILHLISYSRNCFHYLYQLFYLRRSEEVVEMAAVGNGVGKSTDDEMEDVHAKDKLASAEKKVKISKKVSQL